MGGDRSAPRAAQLVDGRVGGDAVAPRAEGGTPVEACDAARDRDHRLLGGVERVFGMRDDAAAHRVDAIGVTVEEDLERAAVATDGPGDERAVVLVTQPSPRPPRRSAWSR